MSADAPSTAAKGYTLRNALDDSIHYDCNLCSASSPTLDAARAHHAVHVAGPELLPALKEVVRISNRKHDAWDAARAAIAKAEPKG